MRTKRIDEIELYIREKKSVSLDTLCEVFNVSKNTVRRDIATLEQSGKIKKVYGGVTIKRETLSFVDGNIAEYLKAYNITKAFMSCTGISIQNGLSNASSEEYLVKKSVIENSTIRFALADHSKFGDFSLMTFCPFKDIDHILTDQLPSEEFCDFAKMHSINIETP